MSLGAGTPASDPSPRNRGPSSHFVNWAASRIVNGLTRTVTEMEAAPSVAAIPPANNSKLNGKLRYRAETR